MCRDPKNSNSTTTKYPRPPMIHPNRVQVSTIPRRMSATKEKTNKMAQIIRSERSNHEFCSFIRDQLKSQDIGCRLSLQTVAAYLHLPSDVASSRTSCCRAAFAKAMSLSNAKSLGTGTGGGN